MDHDGPHVDEHEKTNICQLLKWEQEREHVVWNALREAIERVECVRCKWGRHDPFVMWLVQALVDGRMVQSAVNQIDPEVREDEKEWKLDECVVLERRFSSGVVQLRVSTNFGKEASSSQQGHDRHCFVSLTHFHLDLILEEFRMLECGFVEYEII